jgi:hypothetical protein
MHSLDGAREEFELAPSTSVTKVDRVSSAELLAARGGRRPEDARAERITLYPVAAKGVDDLIPPSVIFWGSSAWSLADLMLVAWADTIRLGRSARVEFSVHFGDGTTYLGVIEISRGIKRGRSRLAEQCKRLETFAAAFCPEVTLPKDTKKVEALRDYFFKNYEVGAPRSRKSTPLAVAQAS